MSTEEKHIDIKTGVTWRSLICAVEKATMLIDGKSVCERDAIVLEGAARSIREALQEGKRSKEHKQ